MRTLRPSTAVRNCVSTACACCAIKRRGSAQDTGPPATVRASFAAAICIVPAWKGARPASPSSRETCRRSLRRSGRGAFSPGCSEAECVSDAVVALLMQARNAFPRLDDTSAAPAGNPSDFALITVPAANFSMPAYRPRVLECCVALGGMLGPSDDSPLVVRGMLAR